MWDDVGEDPRSCGVHGLGAGLGVFRLVGSSKKKGSPGPDRPRCPAGMGSSRAKRRVEPAGVLLGRT